MDYLDEFIEVGIINPISDYVLFKSNLDEFKNDIQKYLGEFNNISIDNTNISIALKCVDYKEHKRNNLKVNSSIVTNPREFFSNGQLLVITDIFNLDFIYEINEGARINLYKEFIEINSLRIFKEDVDVNNSNLFLKYSVIEYLKDNLFTDFEAYEIEPELYEIKEDIINQIEFDKYSFKSNIYSQPIEVNINGTICLIEIKSDFNNLHENELILKYYDFFNDEEIYDIDKFITKNF